MKQFAPSVLDKGKQPAMEVPYTDASMDRQTSTLKSQFSDRLEHSYQKELPRIVSHRNSMEDNRSLPSFHTRLRFAAFMKLLLFCLFLPKN